MKLNDYISEKRGRLNELAQAIGAHTPDVSRWAKNKRPVPITHCFSIEEATGGVVTRKDLRPDDWHLIWPELAEHKAGRRSTDPKS
jgi:DNA-binding transcriptional regulator YdaS (Cro superfamily)